MSGLAGDWLGIARANVGVDAGMIMSSAPNIYIYTYIIYIFIYYMYYILLYIIIYYYIYTYIFDQQNDTAHSYQHMILPHHMYHQTIDWLCCFMLGDVRSMLAGTALMRAFETNSNHRFSPLMRTYCRQPVNPALSSLSYGDDC